MTRITKLLNFLFSLVTFFFINNLVSGQDFDFVTTFDFGLPMVVMEAEHYSSLVSVGDITETTGSTWVDTSTTPEGFSGNGFMKAYNPGSAPARVDDAIANAGYLRYNIYFPGVSTYYIWARASRTGGSDDSFHAALANGDNIIDKVDMIAFTGSLVPKVNTHNWVWIYYSNQYAEVAQVDVPSAGVFNFRVYVRERDFKIDKIILTSDASYIPDSMSTGPDETIFTGLESLIAGKAGFQVYPNPVISDATISYVLNKTEQVSLKVYNVLGEEVTTLSDEIQKAGKHEFKWSACDLSGKRLKGGLYFLRIKAGEETRTIKTILSRD
jgi:hypothetical protein